MQLANLFKRRTQDYFNIFFSLVIIFNVLMHGFYQFITYRKNFHSDSAVSNILAQEIIETGHYFPPDWYYANGDLWVFFNHTIILILSYFSENSYSTHALSGMINLFFIIFSLWYAGRFFELGKTRNLIVIAIWTSGVSWLYLEFLFGQVAYAFQFYFSIFLLISFYKVANFYQGFGKKEIYFNACLLFILTIIISWSNSKRMIVYYAIPLSCAILLVAWNMYRNKDLKIPVLAISIVCAGFLTGLILNQYFLSQVAMSYGAANFKFIDEPKLICEKNLLYWEGFFNFFGYSSNNLLDLNKNLYNSWRLLSAIAFLFAVYYAIRSALNSNYKIAVLLGFSTTALGLSSFFFLFTTLSISILEWRYMMVPAMLLSLIAAHTWNLQRNSSNNNFKVAILSILIIPVCFCGWYLMVEPGLDLLDVSRPFAISRKLSAQEQLINFLKEKNLDYGYATYWNSHVLTVLSNQTVKVRPVEIVNGYPVPMLWLSSKRWYTPGSDKRFFLLLSEHEKNLIKNRLGKISGLLVDTLKFSNYHILVFKNDIANQVPGWNRYAIGEGFYDVEIDDNHSWFWAKSRAVLDVNLVSDKKNKPDHENRHSQFIVTFNVVTDSPQNIFVEYNGQRQKILDFSENGKHIQISYGNVKNKSDLIFTSDLLEKELSSTDSRKASFIVSNLSIEYR